MSQRTYLVLSLAVLGGIVALILIGQRVAPPQQASNSAESRQACKLEAPEPLKAAAAQWCALELFSQVTVSTKDQDAIAVVLFSQNGAQVWQMQSGGLMNDFRSLTDRLAADAKGMNVAVDVHGADDTRIAACARLVTDAAAACEAKK